MAASIRLIFYLYLSTSLGFAILLLISGCSSEEKEANVEYNLPEPVTVDSVEVFSDFEKSGLVNSFSMELLPDGNLAVLDTKLNQVFVLDQRGELVKKFGTEGKGPGESTGANSLQLTSEYINTIDSNLFRINQFDYSGEFVRALNYGSDKYMTFAIRMVNDHAFATGTLGRHESLIRLHDTSQDTNIFMGESYGNPFDEDERRSDNEILAQGEVPPRNKNQVLLYATQNHLYAFLTGVSRLQKYTLEGDLLWDEEIDIPMKRKIFNARSERAKEELSKSNRGVTVTHYIKYSNSIKVIDGDIWLLWQSLQNEPTPLVRVDSEGNIKTIYHLQDKIYFYDFTYNPDDSTLYLTHAGTEQVYRTTLPE